MSCSDYLRWLGAMFVRLQSRSVCEAERVCFTVSLFSWENGPLSTQTLTSQGHVNRNYTESK